MLDLLRYSWMYFCIWLHLHLAREYEHLQERCQEWILEQVQTCNRRGTVECLPAQTCEHQTLAAQWVWTGIWVWTGVCEPVLQISLLFATSDVWSATTLCSLTLRPECIL